MRIALLLLTVAVLFIGLAATAPAQDSQPSAPAGLTLKWEAPEPGAVQSEQSASELDYMLAIRDATGVVRRRSQLSRITAQKKTVMTLAVIDRAESKVLVTYEEWRFMNTVGGGQPQVGDEPGVGKSYIVENRTGDPADLDLRMLDGRGVVERETAVVLTDNASVGNLPALARLLDGKTVSKGDKIVPSEEMAADMFGDGYVSATYTYTGKREERSMECIVLQAEIKTTMELPNGSMLNFHRKGEILLMADTLWPVKLELSGPVTVTGLVDHPQLGKLEFSGEGKSSVSNSFNYSADLMPDDPGVAMEPGTATIPSLHDFTLEMLDGTEKNLADYKGKVVLVVNVASECGFTPQYEALQALSQKYGDKFVVLGFPCNDFGGQEPGTAEEIRAFCTDTYKVTFPLFAKLSIVAGDKQAPLYAFLESATGSLPRWNFFKYLVDGDGNVLGVWDPRTTPENPGLVKAIEDTIAGR